MRRKQLFAAVTVGTMTVLLNTGAIPQASAAVAGIFAYPRANQTQVQQSRDEFECRDWAMRETGFDPNAAAPPPAYAYNNPPPPPPPRQSDSGMLGIGARPYSEGGILQDAGVGAALGAVGGAIAGDAGQGAALGAVASVLFGGVQRATRNDTGSQYSQQQQPAQWQGEYQYQQRANQEWNSRMENFRRAYGACMSARSYEVR